MSIMPGWQKNIQSSLINGASEHSTVVAFPVLGMSHPQLLDGVWIWEIHTCVSNGLQVQHKARMVIRFHHICHILDVEWLDGTSLEKETEAVSKLNGKRVLSILNVAMDQDMEVLSLGYSWTKGHGTGQIPVLESDFPATYPGQLSYPSPDSLTFSLLSISCFAVREKPYPDGFKVILSLHFLFLGCVLSKFIQYIFR